VIFPFDDIFPLVRITPLAGDNTGQSLHMFFDDVRRAELDKEIAPKPEEQCIIDRGWNQVWYDQIN
jgi:hypothetical protein